MRSDLFPSRCLGREECVAQTLMRTFFMIMMHERADRRSEMRFAEEHHSIQALRFGRPDKPFGERVQIGTPRWQDQWLHATVA